jgi:hypothetical protein
MWLMNTSLIRSGNVVAKTGDARTGASVWSAAMEPDAIAAFGDAPASHRHSPIRPTSKESGDSADSVTALLETYLKSGTEPDFHPVSRRGESLA